MNKIRSSRAFEKECKRNIEVIWLLKGLHPDHNTISNFRRDNSKSIKKVFRAIVKLAQSFNLIGGKLIAGDSTKLRAQNSKKNNYRRRQAIVEHPYGTIKRQWAYSYILTKKTKQRAEADVGLMLISYNLKRIIYL